MKKVRIALTCLTFALAVTGVVVAKANEKKRTTTTVGYISDSNNAAYSITLQTAAFDDNSVTLSNQAQIVDANGTQHAIFENTGRTTKVKFVAP